jgi:hypothetical protein
MPTLSIFFGIIISMYYEDHNPPHFHVKYNEHGAIISIETFEVLKGKLPNRVLGLVLEWASQHRIELEENWNLAKQNKALSKIQPLD